MSIRSAVLGLLLFAVPALGHAADGVPAGTWKTEGLTPEEQERLEASIRKATSGLAAVVRPIARQALERAIRPCERVRIWTEDGSVGVQCDDLPPAVADPDGPTVRWTGHDGRTHALTHRLRSSTLVQEMVARRGRRINRFVADGQVLRAEVTLQSRLLSSPISYTVTYR